MGDDDNRLHRMESEWCKLDEVVIISGQSLDAVGQWPWLSSDPGVQAAWEALTRPEHLADLEYRLAYWDGGAGMNHWAAEVTRKAIEACKSRANEYP
jgi:hypothetical protein